MTSEESELRKENEALRKALKESTDILRIIYHAWKYSGWNFPNVGGYRMDRAVSEGERLTNTEKLVK